MANYRKEKQYMSIKRKEKIIAHLHPVKVIINIEVSTCKEKKKQELFLEDVLSITHKKWFVNSFIEKS